MPTRDKANWYIGQGGSPVSELDTSHAPEQTTNYVTTDDPTKDEDTPATVGNGSRHNNTVVGQVPFSYDNNRNLLSEGVLEYEYDYRDVLCTVKRLSDGATVITHQNDAFGYRVASHVTWELGRRAHFDTRFELDVDMDSDGNATAMGYVDGGMAASIVDVVNEAAWTSRLDLMPTEDQYHDFLVNVPTVVGEYSDPFGYVALDHNRALWIFKGEYRFADITDPNLNIVASVSATTAGQHIIGFDPGNGKIFLDGSLLMNVSNPKGLRILARFGSQGLNPGGLLDEGAEGDPGLELLEYQSYMPTFSRNEDPTPAPGGLDLQTVPGPFLPPTLPPMPPWWPPFPNGPGGDDGDGGDGSGNFYMMEVDSDGGEVIQSVPLVDSLSWDVRNFGTTQTCFALENARGGAAGIVSDGVAESGSEGTFETIGLIQYVAFDASGATTVYKPAETVTGLLDEDLGSILHSDQGTSTSVGTNARVSNAQGYNFVIKTPGIADWIGDISDEEIKKIMDDWDGPILPEQKPMPLSSVDGSPKQFTIKMPGQIELPSEEEMEDIIADWDGPVLPAPKPMPLQNNGKKVYENCGGVWRRTETGYYWYYERDGKTYRRRILDPTKRGPVKGVEGEGIIYENNLSNHEEEVDGIPEGLEDIHRPVSVTEDIIPNGARVLGGVAEIAAGIGMCSTGVGCILGIPMIIHGLMNVGLGGRGLYAAATGTPIGDGAEYTFGSTGALVFDVSGLAVGGWHAGAVKLTSMGLVRGGMGVAPKALNFLSKGGKWLLDRDLVKWAGRASKSYSAWVGADAVTDLIGPLESVGKDVTNFLKKFAARNSLAKGGTGK